VKFDVPDDVGVPVIAPVEAFNVRPAGNEPVITVQFTYGEVPPVAAKVCEYAVDTVPAGKGLAVLIVRVAELTVSANALVAVCGDPAESCT
jgi:hypothetical protein